MNKKAVELNVATIIVVILAVLVLVILALYFTGGMSTLWEKITKVSGAYDQTDVEQARSACVLYCTAGQQTTFCEHEFSIGKIDAEPEIKKCYESPINAHNEQECKNAGFNADSCAPA